MKKTIIQLAVLALVGRVFADSGTEDTRSWGDLVPGEYNFETTFPAEADTAVWQTNEVALVMGDYDDDLDPAPNLDVREHFLHFTTDNDSELKRSLTTIERYQPDVEMGKVYIDAYMRIPAIDFEPVLDEEAKLALYLKDNGAGASPTLTVVCGTFLGESGRKSVALDCAIEANTWHRYRIETYGDKNVDASFGAFTISVDGVIVAAKDLTEKLIDEDCLELFFPNRRERELYAARKIFPTLIEYSDQRAATLTAACFKGSADLDLLTIAAQTDARDAYTVSFAYESEADAEKMTIFVNDSELTGTAVEVTEGTQVTLHVSPKDNWGFGEVPSEWTKNADGSLVTTLAALTEDLSVTIPALTAKERIVLDNVSIVVKEHTTLKSITINWTALTQVTTTLSDVKQGDVLRLLFVAEEGYALDGEGEMTVPLAYGHDRLSATIEGPEAYELGKEPPTVPGGPKTANMTFKLGIRMVGDEPVVSVEQIVNGRATLKTATELPKVVIHGSNDLKTWEPILDKANFKNYHFFKGVIEGIEE